MANKDRQNTWLSLQPITGVKLADDSYTLNVHPSGILFDDSSALTTAHKHQITGVKVSNGGSLLHLFSSGLLFNDNTAQTTAFPTWQGIQPITGVKMSDGSNVLLAYPTGFLNNDGLELNFWTRTLDASRGGSFAGVQVPALFVSGNRPAFGAGQHDGLRLTPTGIRFADHSAFQVGDVEGVTVKSTSESGGSKFLREDGDGTCSWQDPEPVTPEGTAVKSTTNGNELVTRFLRADGDGTCSWQNPSVSDSGAFWSSDWVTEDDDEVALANGATLTFTHSLGSTDVSVGVFINGSASDSGAQEVGNQNAERSSISSGDSEATYGVWTTSATSNTVTVQLADSGFLSIDSSGTSSVVSFGAAAGDYIKIHVIAGGVDTTSITPEGTSVKSTTNSNETSGKVLTADGDGTSSWQDGVSEGTDVKSTTNSNEAVTKFLRADGDGTCSWQNPSLVDAGAFWSSGWVNADDGSTAIANGATLSFAHSLGSTDVLVQIYVADDSSGTNSSALHVGPVAGSGASTDDLGAMVTDLSSNSIEIQLGAEGWGQFNATGYFTFHVFTSKYIKVTVVAGGVDATTITPEGTSVKSTTNGNEAVTKFLRADGDGTCSWQNPALGEAGAFWSSGWVNEDDEGETIAAGKAFKFTHNLGSTDVTVNVFAADDSSGTYATKVDWTYDSINTPRGGIIFDVSNNSVLIRTGNSYLAYPGVESGSTNSGTFKDWDGKYIKVTVIAGGVDATTITPEGTSVKSTTNSNEAVTKYLRADGDGTCSWQNPTLGIDAGAFWSSDWVDEDDDSVAVANGATLRFVHSLGSTDVIARVYANTSASDSGASDVTNSLFWAGANYYGAYITNLASDSITVQLAGLGYDVPNTSGGHESDDSNTHDFAYLKVVIVAGGVDATSITPEGTSVKSTTDSNETLGKVLTADGDGTSSWTVVGSVASENRLAAWASYNSGDSTDSYSLEGYNVSSITHVSTGKTTININAAVISDVSRTVTAGCAIAMYGAGWNPAIQAIDPHLDVYGGGDSICDWGAMVMTTTTCKVKTQNNDNNEVRDYGNVQVVIFGGV